MVSLVLAFVPFKSSPVQYCDHGGEAQQTTPQELKRAKGKKNFLATTYELRTLFRNWQFGALEEAKTLENINFNELKLVSSRLKTKKKKNSIENSEKKSFVLSKNGWEGNNIGNLLLYIFIKYIYRTRTLFGFQQKVIIIFHDVR